MNKLLALFTVAFTLTGCELYFGKGNDGGGDTDRPPGWNCTANAECAAGCFCDVAPGAKQGECAEAGFCDSNADCPPGYVCDSRSSCVPGDQPPPPECKVTADCDDGYTCENGACVSTFTCGGDGLSNPMCTTAPASCPAGGVALIDKATGCYIPNACGNILACDTAPRCQNLQHEADCAARTDDCKKVVNGVNCVNTSTGQACQAGDANCQCDSYNYASCAPKNLN